LPILELRNLKKSYGTSLGVGPVSFAVEEGEFVSLLGPSGCGKTTMLRCISGFERPTSGDILLGGQSILGLSPHERDMGLVFQNYALFPHLTVFENAAFGLRLRRWATDRIAARVGEVLRLVELTGLEARHPAQLSGGQQQRVAIARCLALQPRILLLDEPLSNLDLKLRLQTRTELRNLQRRLGITTLHVTHDRGEALTMSDRIVVLAHGTVEQIGTPRELYESPRTPFVADFIGPSNLLNGRIEAAHGDMSTAVRVGNLILRSSHTPLSTGPKGEVVVLIRPERIRLLRDDESPTAYANIFDAKVVSLRYLGEDLQIELELRDSGPRLTMNVKSGSAECELASGASVVGGIAPRDIRLLAPELVREL
jgi:putative spermidine/putrescine transport system ATP-binding protein